MKRKKKHSNVLKFFFLYFYERLFLQGELVENVINEIVVGTLHLQGEFNFIGSIAETAGNCYTIHAGHYLCNKEFSYLRTVRVTDAVYQCFYSKLITLLLLIFHIKDFLLF